MKRNSNTNLFKKNLLSLFYMLSINLLISASTYGQVVVEVNGLLGKPFSNFGRNINRDAFLGMNFGLFYKLKNDANVDLGLQFSNVIYDGSYFSDLQFIDNLAIRQKSNTEVGMQTLHGVIRANLLKRSKSVIPYFDAILGVNRFYGVTKSEDAFFTGDTDNNGKIDELDGEINPKNLGINTSISLTKSSTKLEHNSISPTFGLGFGLKIKIFQSLKFDTRAAYLFGLTTSYYDYGSIHTSTSSSIESFVLVNSATPVFYWTMGLNYTFE